MNFEALYLKNVRLDVSTLNVDNFEQQSKETFSDFFVFFSFFKCH